MLDGNYLYQPVDAKQLCREIEDCKTRLNQEIVRVLNRPDVKEKFFSVGVETVGSTPDQLATRVKSDVVSYGKIIKDAGIRSK